MTKRFVNFVHDLIFFSSLIINLIAYVYKKNIVFLLAITPRERLIDCEKKNIGHKISNTKDRLYSAHIIKIFIFPSDAIFHAMNFCEKNFRFG